MLPLLESVFLEPGKIVYEPGEPADFVYFPITAIISEYHMLEDGRTAEIGMIGREGAAGLVSLLCAKPGGSWSQTSVCGRAFKIKREALEDYIRGDETFLKCVFGSIGEYIKQISQRSICRNFHPLEERFCCWLLMVRNRQGDDRLSLTQERIADILGVQRPSFTQIARELKKAQIIDYSRGVILIRNIAELQRRACGCHEEIDIVYRMNR